MKHLRLFLVAVATVFGLGASAQTWTGNEVTEGTFYLYNVGAQKFLNNGDPNQEWGTNAYLQKGFGMDIKVEASNDAYTLDTNVSNGGSSHYLNSSTWTDGAATPWIFTPIAEGSTIYEISYDGKYLVANDALDDVVYGDKSTKEANNQWMLVSLEDFKTAMQNKVYSTSDPMDVSVFIQGRSFARNDARNNIWTKSHQGGNWDWVVGAENRYYGNEAWNNTFDVHQDIVNLPAGTYELKCSGFGTNGTTYIYGNTTSKALQTDNTTSFGTDKVAKWKAIQNGEFADNSTGTFTVGDGNLTVGIKRETNIGGDWCVYDEFRLYFYGLDLSEFAAALANAVSAAQAIESSTLPTAAYNALQNVITENNKTYTTVEDYTAATNAIIEATETAKKMVAAFSRYNTVKTNVLAVSSDVNTADADAAANAATTADQVETAVSAVRMALLDNLADKELPEAGYFDLTDAIIDNPTVSQNVDYWTVENPSTDGTGPTTNYGETEFYNRTFDFFQSLTLSKGTYEFGVTGFHRAGNHSTYFYAGDNKILIPGVEKSVVDNMAQAKTYFDNGNGKVALKFALEGEANVIKVGIVNNDTETDKWTIFRNFTLHYYGTEVDLTPYKDAWAEAVAAAEQAIADNPNVTGNELTAVNTAKADTPKEDIDSYTEKTNALVEATQALKAAAAAYNAYAAEKAIADEIGVSTGDAPTTAAEASAKVNELKVAEFNYINEEYPYDYTPVIGDFGTWTGTATVNEQPAEPRYLTGEHWSGIAARAYYEQAGNGWNSNAWTVQYQKTAKLPAGDYMLKVAARSSVDVSSYVKCSATDFTVALPNAGNATKGIDKSGDANFGDGEFVNNGNGFGWEWRFLPFSLTEETEVTMTFYGETNKQYNWMSIADGTLLSKQEIVNVVELKSTDATVVDATVASEVNTDRKLLKGLNTIILPFDVTAEEIGAATILEYKGTSVENDVTTLNFKEVAPVDGKITLQPNVPYAVFVDADQEEALSFGKKNIAPAEDLTTEDANGLFDFVGTFIDLAKGNDVIVKGDLVAGEKEFKKAKGGNRIAAYRAYLKKIGEAEPANIAFNFNGEIVTGIEAVEILNRMSGDIYNINGQKVSRTQKGIYIINGQKVIVK